MAEEPAAPVACPFCGLACDDFFDLGDDLDSKGCGLAAEGLAIPAEGGGPRLAGGAVALDQAVTAAAKLLRGSAAPLIAGLGSDVDGLRAALALAERVGATVDHLASDGLFRNLSVLRRKGMIALTLGELRSRCDLLVVIGADPRPGFPRFYQRWFNASLPAPIGGGTRRVLFLGAEPLPETRADLGEIPITVVPGEISRLAELALGLRSLVAGDYFSAGSIAGVSRNVLTDVAQRLGAARFGAAAWAAEAFTFPHGDIAVSALLDLIRALNRTTRFGAVPLTGRDNGMGAVQVATWQTGYPLRLAFEAGTLRHDPTHLSWRYRLAQADLLVWLSSFRREPPPPFDGPVIALTAPGTAFAAPPAVCIPVGVPGLDHAGDVFRSDGVVALRLARRRPSTLPRAAEVLQAMNEALAC